jgi:hypothetical protein
MSEGSCAHCGDENAEGAPVCANCGIPISEAARPKDDEALPEETPADTQTQAPSPPVGQPFSFLPPTREAQQNRVRRGWPTYLTLRKFAKTTWADWLPSWFTLPVAVIASVVLTLALFFVYGSVRAGVFDLSAVRKPLQGESKEAQTAPEGAPTATPSPSTSTSASDVLSSFLPPFLSSSL